MAQDQIRYDLLVQEAMKSVVRRVLTDAARDGLPGEHHFFIAFDTRHPQVKLSTRMLEKYPEEMTIVLQHQFWDLKVNDEGFEVGLSFGGISEKLIIPFDAVTGFFDPSIQFALQFETASSEDGSSTEDGKIIPQTNSAPSTDTPAEAVDTKASTEADSTPSEGATIVSLDKFRKR